MTWQGAIILTILGGIYLCGMLIALETKTGKTMFRFIMSFFVSNEKFESTDWNKPIPNWQSALIWIVFLGLGIYFIFFN